MSALRLVLIAANALLLAWTAYLFSTEPGTHRDAGFWFGWGLLICLSLNFIYLLLNDIDRKSNWRIFRLIGLWFDAKESELRQRADQSRQGK
jgi:hypothetical protein